MIRESWQRRTHKRNGRNRERRKQPRETERRNSGKEMERYSPRSIDYIEGRRVTFLLVDFYENRATAFTR